MRLGSCIALELAVAVGAVGGVWFGVGRAADLAGAYLVASPADAATIPEVAAFDREIPTRLPGAHLQVAQASEPSVFGLSDAELLAPLGASRVTGMKTNRGGTSLSLRLEFASGARAAFKPEQIHTQSDPRREIAAYRIDRMLGIGRVPPAKPAAIPYLELLEAIEPRYRTYMSDRLEEAVVRDGIVHGEVSWWVPRIKLAELGGEPIDTRAGRDLWTSYLQVGGEIPAEAKPLVEQIAAVIVFDVLIDNADRWSGSNTMMSPDGKILYFMDNTLSFSIFKAGHSIPNAALRRIQVFPRKLVKRLRGLTETALTAALSGDETALGALLGPPEIRAVIGRRDNILEHIDRLIAEFGEDAVLALP